MRIDVAGIYVVNLDKRHDRWEMFQQGAALWEIAFGKMPERLAAVLGIELPGYDQKPWFRSRTSERRKKSWAGKAGCILSHRKAIQQAADQGWSNVLILEDDALLTDASAKVWQDALRTQLDAVGKDWAAIYLCTTRPISPCRIIAESGGYMLIESAGAFGTVAYLINSRIFKHLLKSLPNENNIWPWVARHKTIDRWLSQNLMRFGKIYAISPSLAGHQLTPSDITMTPESDWNFDFTHKNVKFVRSNIAFNILKYIRSSDNLLRRIASLFRLVIKQLRGL